MKEANLELRGFKLHGFKCECGEEMFNPLDVEAVRQAVSEPVKARNVAHSLVITMPKKLAKLAKIKAGDSLKWIALNGDLILQKT